MEKLLNKLYKYWMKFAHVLGTINGFIILFVFYFIIIGLYALFYRTIKLIFRLKNKITTDSHWNKKEELGEGLENLKFQF